VVSEIDLPNLRFNIDMSLRCNPVFQIMALRQGAAKWVGVEIVARAAVEFYTILDFGFWILEGGNIRVSASNLL
jgi:hypothetical protein